MTRAEPHAKDAPAGIVGDENVADDPGTLRGFARDHSFVLGTQPHFVVRPGSEREVQTLVLWASTIRTPLVAVSSGPPHFYGDTVPTAAGAVMVDLTRMNGIKSAAQTDFVRLLSGAQGTLGIVTWASVKCALLPEQFVSSDPNDLESTKAAVRHMEDAVRDAAAHGFPPGKEAMYLELSKTDEQVFAELAAANQPAVYRFQRRIKDAIDPNDIGDRLYATLPAETG